MLNVRGHKTAVAPIGEGIQRHLGVEEVCLFSGLNGELLRLNHQHEKHALRYTVFVDDGEPTFTPEPEDLFSMLEELMMAGRIATHGV